MTAKSAGTRRKTTPTPAQVAAWDALDQLTLVGVVPPSIIDLMAELSVTSKSVMHSRLQRGVREGRVTTIRTRGGKKYVPVWWRRMISENMSKYYKYHGRNYGN